MLTLEISEQIIENTHEWIKSNHSWEDFWSLSLVVNWQVDFVTWEIESLISEQINNWQKKEWNWKINNANWKKIWDWWELKIKQLFNWYKHTSPNHLRDLESKDSLIECKACEKWNGIVIREKQLIRINDLEIKNKYYSLLFYKRNKNWKKIINQIFIFPVEIIVFIYNKLNNKRIQSNTWIFKRLHLWNTIKEYNKNIEWYKKREVKMWGITVKIIENEDHNLEISKKAVEL